MKNIALDIEKQAVTPLEDKEISNTNSCFNRPKGHMELPDCVTLTLLMAMTMNSKDIRKMCYKHCLKSNKINFDPGSGLWSLHTAGHDQEMPVAKDLSRYFKRRFSTASSRVGSLDPDDLAQSIGDRQWPAPLLWGAGTDPRLEMRKRAQILSHTLIWRLMEHFSQMKLGLSVLNHNVKEKKDVLKENEGHRVHLRKNAPEITMQSVLKKQLREKEAEINNLKMKMAGYSHEIAELRQRPLREGALKREVKKLAYELEQANTKIIDYERLIKSHVQANDENQQEDQNTGPDKRENTQNGKVFTILCPEDARGDCNHCTDQKKCHCPLKGLRVAVVGGLDRMEPEYRKIIRELGADFLFHNGNCSSGRHVLKNMICKADIILFITSVNSHGALRIVKATCKKTGKQFRTVRNPGANSVYKSLSEIAA